MNKITVQWHTFITKCDILTERVKLYNDKIVLNKITDIISIARGGGIPAQMVAYKCNVHRISSVGICYYDQNDKKMLEPIIYQDIPTNLEGKNILIVDEICDTGCTFTYVMGKLKEHGCMNISTACIYRKKGSMYIPDIYVEEISKETWLLMPYEVSKEL